MNFLPEKHTDFIFTLWAEEWGLAGGVMLIFLLGLIILYGYWIAFHCRHTFGRLLAFGLTFNFSIYVMINIGMVMGLLPVVGIPLPLMSYGGTAMLTVHDWLWHYPMLPHLPRRTAASAVLTIIFLLGMKSGW